MSLKRLVTDPILWKAFCEELDAMEDSLHRTLVQSDNATTLYRAQGGVYAIGQLRMLRDKYKDSDA